MPWDSLTQEGIAGAHRKYLSTTGNLDLERTGLDQSYGLAPGFNDYQSNPYSRAALLESKFQQANRGTMNSAGLQLYSGSTGNRLAANRSDNSINRDALERAYRDAVNGIEAKRVGAQEGEGEEIRGFEREGIGRAEKAPLPSDQAPLGKPKPSGSRRSNRRGQTRKSVANSRRHR